MKIFFIALGILFFGGLFSLFLKDKYKLPICTFFVGISAMMAMFPVFDVLLYGKIIKVILPLNSVFGNVNFTIDPLSAFFIFVILTMSFFGILYSNGYVKPYLQEQKSISSHCFFLMLLITSMLCVVTIQNALVFLIAWEIMSLSSFFLVIFESEKPEVLNAGIKYMIYMHISVIFLIIAFAVAAIYSNSYNFSDFSEIINNNKHVANIVFMLAFAGFGTKAGFFPFHNWLPDAHPAAPSHVSGIMSGVMIKTGIYGILRTIHIIGFPTKLIAYTILITAVISALWGVLYAITQHDIKRLLAYHSIENIGIIGIGIGIGLLGIIYNNPTVAVLGFAGGILHILNHSIFKELLFFAAGSVYNKTHTRNIESLGGLIKKMPYTSSLFIIGAMAICALPPFNGFISEFLIYAAMISGLPAPTNASFMAQIISLASLALIGTMAILCFSKASGIMFLGSPRSESVEKIESDSDKSMIIPMMTLAMCCLFIGLFPQFVLKIILNPVLMFTHYNMMQSLTENAEKLMTSISILFAAFAAVFVIIYAIRFKLNKHKREYSTWGCGYNKINSRMQYSASSFANLFISTLKPMFKRVPHVKKPKELFPKEAFYEVEIEDIEEAYIVKPILKIDEKILSKFERIQNGNMQQYILFGLIFLIISIIGLIYLG